jgi:transglutaminase-like putative cysteine protease
VRFVVRHQTLYRYSVPVVLAPHLFRLTPRTEHRLLSRSLTVYPEPVDQRDEVDAFGNPVTAATFSGRPSDKLRIDSRFELDTPPPPALSGLALPPLPWTGLPAEELAPFRPSGDVTDLDVADFARAVAAEAGHQPLAFLDSLCRTIFARADRHVRPTGDAQTAAETLRTWRGACRDYTVLFLTAARSLGMPARFCSGYQSVADTPDGRRYLHAWPEVFLPDLGWRGWDPTHGIRVDEGHVALCAAPEQAGTMPVVGSYSFDGPSVTSTLEFSVDIATGS